MMQSSALSCARRAAALTVFAGLAGLAALAGLAGLAGCLAPVDDTSETEPSLVVSNWSAPAQVSASTVWYAQVATLGGTPECRNCARPGRLAPRFAMEFLGDVARVNGSEENRWFVVMGSAST